MTARIPVALFMYPRLSPGSKLLYARLTLFRGPKRDGYCNPDLHTMASAMVTSVDTVERWLGELIAEGFIARRRRRRAAAEIVFLPHPCFFDSATTPNQETPQDSTDLPNQNSSQDSAEERHQGAFQDSAETRNQEVLNSATTRLRFRKFAPLDSANLPAPYKEENHSSKTIHENHRSMAAAACEVKVSPPPAERNQDLETIREWLWNAAKDSHPDWPPPDDKISSEVLKAGNGRHVLEIGRELQKLYKAGSRPDRSYAWFVAVLRDRFARQETK
jgi:hypothetical protein